jgi:hypothetical protein
MIALRGRVLHEGKIGLPIAKGGGNGRYWHSSLRPRLLAEPG